MNEQVIVCAGGDFRNFSLKMITPAVLADGVFKWKAIKEP
jgi:hypothetical protein